MCDFPENLVMEKHRETNRDENEIILQKIGRWQSDQNEET